MPRFPKIFKPAAGVPADPSEPGPAQPAPAEPATTAEPPAHSEPVPPPPPAHSEPAPIDLPAEAPVPAEAGVSGEPLVVALPEGEAVVEEPSTRARSYRERAKLQRRLRYLRQTRELAFRDLGGFVFDQHRFGRSRDDIVRAKIAGLESIDQELRALELALDQRQELLVLQEPGISVCPRCGVIHGSDANFCPGCALPRGSGAGLPLRDPTPGATTPTPGAPAPPAGAWAPAVTPAAGEVHTADQPTTEFKVPPAQQ